MKTEVKKIDSIKREISIEVTGEVVKNKFEEMFQKIAKEAKVPGFRPGNAPRDILEKHYSSYAHEQVLKELVPEVYNQALDKEGLDVIELPNITDIKLDRSTLSFKATVEVSPEIKLKDYKGLKVNYQKIEVSLDELKRSVDSLKEARKVDPVRNSGTSIISSKVSNGVDTLDDNFAKRLGYPNLQELEKAMERQIFLQKENARRQRIETEIVEALTKDLDFKIPQALIDRQLQDLLRQAKLDLVLKGLPREKVDEQEKTLIDELKPESEKQVRVYLILAEVAKREKITLDDHMPRQVMEFLLKEADWQFS